MYAAGEDDECPFGCRAEIVWESTIAIIRDGEVVFLLRGEP